MLKIIIPIPKLVAAAAQHKVDFDGKNPATYLRNFFIDLMLTPMLASQGGTFDQVYRYTKIRSAADEAKEREKDFVILDDQDVQRLKDLATSYTGWPFAFPEAVLAVREALDTAVVYTLHAEAPAEERYHADVAEAPAEEPYHGVMKPKAAEELYAEDLYTKKSTSRRN